MISLTMSFTAWHQQIWWPAKEDCGKYKVEKVPSRLQVYSNQRGLVSQHFRLFVYFMKHVVQMIRLAVYSNQKLAPHYFGLVVW